MGFLGGSDSKESACNSGDLGSIPASGRSPGGREWPTPLGFPGGEAGGITDVGLVPGLGRVPGGRHGNPLQYSCLENPMGRGAMGYCP